jgi:hypothetical protein
VAVNLAHRQLDQQRLVDAWRQRRQVEDDTAQAAEARDKKRKELAMKAVLQPTATQPSTPPAARASDGEEPPPVPENYIVLRDCTELLLNLAAPQASAAAMLENSGLELLVSLCKPVPAQQAAVSEAASRALAILAGHGALRPRLVSGGCVLAMAEMCASAPLQGTLVKNAARALQMLATACVAPDPMEAAPDELMDELKLELAGCMLPPLIRVCSGTRSGEVAFLCAKQGVAALFV